MMILILLILMITVFMVVRKQRNVRAEARYWERITELEAQRKKQILATAIKIQQRNNCNSNTNDDWKQAS